MNNLQYDSSVIKEDLNFVKKNLKLQRFGTKYYQKITNKFLSNTGKMLRASLTCLFGRYMIIAKKNSRIDKEKKLSKIYKAATAIELLHLATLVHDDVIDKANKRREEPTLQKYFGNKDAVYLGDTLFTEYLKIIIQIAPDISFVDYHVRTMENVLNGELEQDRFKFNSAITLKQYFQIIKMKTASLFSLSCFSGYWLASGEKQISDIKGLKESAIINEFGINLGIIFQLIDDLKDFNTKFSTGKEKFKDIKQGIYTLPIILAIKNKNFKEKLVKKSLSIPQIETFFKKNPQYLKKAVSIINSFISKTKEDLQQIKYIKYNEIFPQIKKIVDLLTEQVNLIAKTNEI